MNKLSLIAAFCSLFLSSVVFAADAPAAKAATTAQEANVTVENATATLSTDSAAVYFDITNNTDKAVSITGASVASTVAAKAELHETSDDHGVAKMTAVKQISVDAKGTANFKQGGAHVMLTGVAAKAGDTVTVTLTFSDKTTKSFEVALEQAAASN